MKHTGSIDQDNVKLILLTWNSGYVGLPFTVQPIFPHIKLTFFKTS